MLRLRVEYTTATGRTYHEPVAGYAEALRFLDEIAESGNKSSAELQVWMGEWLPTGEVTSQALRKWNSRACVH